MKIILVDDERSVIEHLLRLVPWAEYGYEIAATASDGRSALRLCEEHRPQIMIVDIRMPAMDGLELIRQVSQRRLGVKFIIMSAHQDFDYARQAIAFEGVSSYLIKHTVDAKKLLDELGKAKQAWESDEVHRRLLTSRHIQHIVTGAGEELLPELDVYKGPFVLLLLQADIPFNTDLPLPAPDFQPPAAWTAEPFIRADQTATLEWAGEFPAGETQLAVLLATTGRSSNQTRAALIEMARSLQECLRGQYGKTFSVFHSQANDCGALPAAWARLKAAARHAVFCGRQALACADDLPLPGVGNFAAARGAPGLVPLLSAVEERNISRIESAIQEQFKKALQPAWDNKWLSELASELMRVLNELRRNYGLVELDFMNAEESGMLYHIHEVRQYFLAAFRHIAAESSPIPGKLSRALQYIHKHYQQDLNIADVASAVGLSPSYLHFLFKEDLERTFLDYLTGYRIQQAKRILLRHDVKMFEVARTVGYRSTQHFSKVFKKTTGLLPHQYRDRGLPS